MFDNAHLLQRFPALRRLSASRRLQSLPVILQMAATDCGVACLAMVLSYYGCQVSLEDVRNRLGTGRDGTSAGHLLTAAHFYGLRGRGVRLELSDLAFLPRAAILHWGFNHFVVFERLRQGAVDVIDPAFGRRRIPLATFGRQFTGVALLLEPSDRLHPSTPADTVLRRAMHHLAGQAGRWPRVVVLSLCLQALALALPSITGVIVDSVVPRGDHRLLSILALSFIALMLFYGLASLLRSQLLLEIRTQIDVRLSVGFLDHLVSLPYSFFLRRSAGDLLTRLHGTATLREILTINIISALIDGVLVLGYLLLLSAVDLTMLAILIGLGLLQSSIFILSSQLQGRLLAADLEVQSRAHSYEVEMLTAMETLKALGCERRAVSHWSGLYVDVLNAGLSRGRLAALTDSLLATLRLLGPLLILVYGADAVLKGQYSLGLMLALASLAGSCLGPIHNLVQAAGQLVVARVYLERIADVMRTAPEQRQLTGTAVRLQGSIRLEQVSLCYTPGSRAAIDDVSVDIRPGQFVAIVGATGSGKSSLARLILGLYPPTSGRVLLDGVNLSNADLDSLRRQLGVVTQHTDLFASTIRENITLTDPTATLEQVHEAARRAQIHDDIMAMPLQYETPLVDRGMSLSGGQRQRLALARALLRQPALLLLDEATSALDGQVEREIFAELAQLRCTRIVIAHRLSTIRDADLILFIERGRLTDQGRHDELVARCGAYAKLIAAQLAAPLPAVAHEVG